VRTTPKPSEAIFEALESSKCDLEAVKALLKDCPDLAFERSRSTRQTPLHSAAGYGHKDAAELLLASRADVDARASEGSTPLHFAAERFYCRAVAELLLARGATVDAKNDEGDTPLHRAARHGGKDMVRLLLDNHAEVDARAKDGGTPLHEAAFEGRKDVVELLLARGADANAKTTGGVTPSSYAAGRGHKEIEALLATGKPRSTAYTPGHDAVLTTSEELPPDPEMNQMEAMMNAQAWVWLAERDDSIQFILNGEEIAGIWLANFPTNAPRRTVLHLFCVKEIKRTPSNSAKIEAVWDRIYDGKYDIRRNSTKGGFDVLLR
jgi:ankyrin repeat protein